MSTAGPSTAHCGGAPVPVQVSCRVDSLLLTRVLAAVRRFRPLGQYAANPLGTAAASPVNGIAVIAVAGMASVDSQYCALHWLWWIGAEHRADRKFAQFGRANFAESPSEMRDPTSTPTRPTRINSQFKLEA